MRTLLRTGVACAVLLLGACASTSPVEVTSDGDNAGTPTTVAVESPAVEESGERDDDEEEFYPEEIPVGDYEPPAPGFILEPANAQLGQLDGWDTIDEWYWEPIGFLQSPDCEPFNDVLALEDWGVITTLYLKEGTELYHFTAELNTAERVVGFVESFIAVGTDCSTTDFGDATLTFTSLEAEVDGFTIESTGSHDANWFFEQNTRSTAVVVSRNNVVSILQVVAAEGFDMAEFDVLVAQATATLAAVPGEVAADPDLAEG